MTTDELFPYQVEGAQWLAGKRFALLADECGLGKTCQAISACDLANAQRVLVLGPAISRYTWRREFQLWSRRPEALVVKSSSGLPPTPAPTTICSYDLAAKPSVRKWLTSVRWDVLVLDEVHFLKSSEAQRTAAVFGGDGIARCSDRTWALSGTPAPNHAAEMWVLLRCFGVFAGDYWTFVNNFCTTVDDGFTTRIVGTDTKQIPRLRALLAPILLRRKKEQVLTELPPITYGQIEVEPGPVDFEIHYPEHFILKDRSDVLRAQFARDRQSVEAAFAATEKLPAPGASQIALLGSLSQSVASWRRYIGLQKVPQVADLVTMELDCNAYDKVVIFACHRAVLKELWTRLHPFGPVILYGGTPQEKREAHIKRFQTTKKCRVFLGNVIAAGTNITLTAASQVILIEPDWVPANNAQAVMRCHRIGQTRPVSVRAVTLAGDDLDQKIMGVLRRKTKELSSLFAV